MAINKQLDTSKKVTVSDFIYTIENVCTHTKKPSGVQSKSGLTVNVKDQLNSETTNNSHGT
jgi:hypothetical protein